MTVINLSSQLPVHCNAPDRVKPTPVDRPSLSDESFRQQDQSATLAVRSRSSSSLVLISQGMESPPYIGNFHNTALGHLIPQLPACATSTLLRGLEYYNLLSYLLMPDSW